MLLLDARRPGRLNRPRRGRSLPRLGVKVKADRFDGSLERRQVQRRVMAAPHAPLRVSEDQEAIGLDLSQHGEVMQDMSPFAPAVAEPLAKIA